MGSPPANQAGFTVEPPLYPRPQNSPWQQRGLQSWSPSLEAGEFLKTQQGQAVSPRVLCNMTLPLCHLRGLEHAGWGPAVVCVCEL